MASEFFRWGKRTRADALRVPEAVAFVRAVRRQPHARLLYVRTDGNSDGVVVRLSPETPSRPAADIQRFERLCVVFERNALRAPEVLALRKDFPEDLLHVNLRPPDQPTSLCLFDEDYRVLRSTLTPEMLLDRVFSWLARAARDEAHLPDQPLEPFLLTGARILCDPKVFERSCDDNVLAVVRVKDANPELFYLADPREVADGPFQLAVPLRAQPWNSRVIHHSPDSLADLARLLRPVGVDLIQELQARTANLCQRHDQDEQVKLMQCLWLVLLQLPKARGSTGVAEATEYWAFLVAEKIRSLAVKLGVLGEEGMSGLLLEWDEPKQLDTVRIGVGRPIERLTRSFARRLAGLPSSPDPSIVVVGAGALGSHIIMNLARQGYGRWTVVDEDQILPHNHSRYALSPCYEAWSKASAIAHEIRALLNDEGAATGLSRDAMTLGPGDGEIDTALASADHLYDFSVSPAVSRHLALVRCKAPRTSAFLLGGGKSMVLLAEGAGRRVRLDDLEGQLALAAVENQELARLYISEDGTPVRYSASCRDVSAVMPEDAVAAHAALASQFLKANVAPGLAAISVWELDKDRLTIRRVNVDPSPVSVLENSGWQVRLTESARFQMRDYRLQRLPNETGGVVIGSFDVQEKIIYACLLYTSPSPRDRTRSRMPSSA